jgi:hypothetical protein
VKPYCRLRPNKGLQRTALSADKIGAILKAGVGPIVLPIYNCAAAEAQAVSPHPIMCILN